MREIKFRAWKHSSKKMYFVTNMIWKEDWIGVNSTDSIGINYVDNHCPNEYELMQYTGLKDKNGVEIYEGDILQHSYKPIGKTEPNVRIFKVVFGDGAFQQYEPGDAENALDIWYEWFELEIIGNIYENPELLK